MTPAVLFRVEVVINSAEVAGVLADLHSICFARSPQEPWSDTTISTLLNVPTTFGLIALGPEEGVVGFIIGRAAADEGEVLTLCVSPVARRHGIATALLDQLTVMLTPRRRILLEVAVTNRAARDLYDSLGYQEVGRRPGYYRRGGKAVDAVILASDDGR